MAYGLEVYKSDGTLKLSLNDRLTRLTSVVTGSIAPGQDVFIPLPSLFSTDWMVCPGQLARTSNGAYIYNGSSVTRTYVVWFIGL